MTDEYLPIKEQNTGSWNSSELKTPYKSKDPSLISSIHIKLAEQEYARNSSAGEVETKGSSGFTSQLI